MSTTDPANHSANAPLLRRRKGISLIWVVPIASFLIGLWLLWIGVISSGQVIEVSFPNGEGIVAGQTEVRYKGIKVGIVTSVEIEKDFSGVIAVIELDRQVKKDVPQNTQFWLVEPKVTAAGVSGLGTIFSGNYIDVQLGNSEETADKFIALNDPPALSYDTPGLHLVLKTPRLGSLNEGDPILYKQIEIGSIQSHAMSKDNQLIEVGMYIKPEYAHLIRKNSRFWNASGIQVEAGLGGVKIQTESVTTLLAGGIAVSDRDDESPAAANGDTFPLYEDYESAAVGIRVKLWLASAQGINNQTKVMFHGMQVGRVLDINLDKKAGKFLAIIGLKPQAEPYLTDQTRFYLVTPQISLAGVSGLDALVNGTYITVDVSDKGKPTRQYEISEGSLPVNYNSPGLHITLLSNSSAGLQIGSPLLYRNLRVGEVENITLNNKNDQVEVNVVVQEQYAQLIRDNTQFWNTSGIEIQAGLGGIHVKSESLAGLLAGGISFLTPIDGGKPAQDRQQFILFRNKETAQSGLQASFELASAEGINAGMTKIIYQGLTIGTIESINLLPDGRGVIANARFVRDAESLLKNDSHFWLVKPQINASNISGLDALLSGPYITVSPGKGQAARRFVVSEEPPAANFDVPGLHVKLQSKKAAGLRNGSPVLYRDITVGEVTDVRPASNGGIETYIHIKPQYAKYVSRDTRFWNANGLELKTGAGGIKVKTDSVAALLAGGVVFGNTDDTNGFAVLSGKEPKPSSAKTKNGDTFQLYDNRDAALNSGATVTLIANNANSLTVGTPIFLQGVNIGQITALHINIQKHAVEAIANIRSDLQDLLKTGSSFHLRTAKLGLARTENLDAFINGSHIDLIAGEGSPQKQFPLLLQDPLVKFSATGLNLILESETLGSIKAGDPVTYRQFKVGNVLGTELSNDGKKVLMYINLWPGYEKLVRNNSRFWRTSGIRVEAGLFSGVDIKTESVETILAGGIAFATPDDPAEQAIEEQTFILANESKDSWLEWSPAL
jgi:paraquat-inducible protein B